MSLPQPKLTAPSLGRTRNTKGLNDMRNILLILLGLLTSACSTTTTPAMCLGTDLTPYPGESIDSPDSACGSVQNLVETRHAQLGCVGEPPPRSECPYRDLAVVIPQHVWVDCNEFIRTATRCEEIVELERLCFCNP